MGVLSEFGIDEERLNKIVKIHDESLVWMYDNMQEIQDSYAGNFIAIHKKRVIANDAEKKNLFDILKKKYSEEEIDEIFIDYINPKGYVLILNFKL